MRHLLLFAALIVSACASRPARETRPTTREESAAALRSRIPTTPEDAVLLLERNLLQSVIDDFRSMPYGDTVRYHSTVGGWIRNNWALWEGGDLAQWFRARGATHPDNMSAILLFALWRRLHGMPLDLDKLIAEANEAQAEWDRLEAEEKAGSVE